jgi:hypothetical protein
MVLEYSQTRDDGHACFGSDTAILAIAKTHRQSFVVLVAFSAK